MPDAVGDTPGGADYRDKDQPEVDWVITRGRQTLGLDVQSTATVLSADGYGYGHRLRRMAKLCGKDWQGGFLRHAGRQAVALNGARNVAASLAWL